MRWEHSFSDPDGSIAGALFSNHWLRALLTTVTFEDMGEAPQPATGPFDASTGESIVFREAFASMRGGWGGDLDGLGDFLASESWK